MADVQPSVNGGSTYLYIYLIIRDFLRVSSQHFCNSSGETATQCGTVSFAHLLARRSMGLHQAGVAALA